MTTLLADVKRLDQAGTAVTTPSAITNTVTLADGSGNIERLTWQNMAIALGARAAADLANVQLAYTESGKIPSSLLNLTGFEFRGDYNPATNTPALADTDTGKVNWTYRITGSANPTARDFGSGSINCSDDEYIAYSGASGSGAWINIGTGPLQQIATGGTGATTAAGARTNLELYSKDEINDRVLGKQISNALVLNGGNSTLATAALPSGTGFDRTTLHVLWKPGASVAATANETVCGLTETGAGGPGADVVPGFNFQTDGTVDGIFIDGTPTVYSHAEVLSNVDPNRWYLLTAVVDYAGGTGYTTYVNGVQAQNSAIGSASLHLTSPQLACGINTASTKGNTIGGVWVLSRAQSAAEIAKFAKDLLLEVADQSGGADGGVYTADFSAGVDSFLAQAGTVAGNIDSIGGKNDNLRFTVNSSNVDHWIERLSSLTVGVKYRLDFEVYVPSANSQLDGYRFQDGTNNHLTDSSPATDTWVTKSVEFVAGGTSLRFDMLDGGSTPFQDAGGDDAIYFRAVKVTAIGAVVALLPHNIESSRWVDASSNQLDGTITGATRLFEPKAQVSGTFTPSITFSSVNTGVTQSAQFGRWRKLDEKTVLISIEVSLSALGSGSGNVTITGLPFTNVSTGYNPCAIAVGCSGMTGLTGALIGVLVDNDTKININQSGATGLSALTQASMTNSSLFELQFVQEIA